MTKGKKSPLKVACKPWPFKPRPGERKHKPLCKWVCRSGVPVRAASFISRRGQHWTAVLHPSTKERGRWQVSIFDEMGAIGDSIRNTCTEALSARDIMPESWKLVDVE